MIEVFHIDFNMMIPDMDKDLSPYSDLIKQMGQILRIPVAIKDRSVIDYRRNIVRFRLVFASKDDAIAFKLRWV